VPRQEASSVPEKTRFQEDLHNVAIFEINTNTCVSRV
jgi:hypothetical protein